MRKLAIILSIILALPMSLVSIPANASVTVTICDPSAANWGGGSGTSSDPYLVCSRSHLENLGSATSGENVKLARSIDLGGSSSPWTPISNFNGVFDGNFNTISGMYVDGDLKNYGFIEELNSGSEFRNVKFADPEVKSEYVSVTDENFEPRAGILAANTLGSTVENIFLESPKISGPLNVSGFLFGTANTSTPASVKHIHVTSGLLTREKPSASFSIYSGGIAGFGAVNVHRASIDGAIEGGLEGDDYGGVIGTHRNATVNMKEIVSNVSFIANPSESFSTVGGILGATSSGDVLISDAIVLGTTGGNGYDSGRVGGMAGLHVFQAPGPTKSTLPQRVIVTGGFDQGSANLAPIDAWIDSTESPADVLFDKDVNSGFTDNAEYGSGKTTSELQTINTYSTAGFNMVSDVPSDWSLDDATDPIWKITEGNYPEQIWVDVSAARFDASEVTETVDLYVYPDESEVIELSSLQADDGVITLDNFDNSLLQLTNLGTSDKRVGLINTPSTAGSLITSFDAEFKKAGVTQKVTFNIKASDEDPSPTVTTFPNDVTASVGDTLWASAYERYLDTSVLVDGLEASKVEEYVYRITTQENEYSENGTSVDLQSLDGYDFLTKEKQNEWYEDTGWGPDGVDYEFYWYAFACVGADEFDVRPATNLRTEYASLEEIAKDSGLDAELNADLRHLVATWDTGVDPQQAVVGVRDASNIVGRWTSDGAPIASLEVVADCASGYRFSALPVLIEGTFAVEKSLVIGEKVSLESLDSSTEFEADSVGLTIGVTGNGEQYYDQALWGLTNIAIAPSGGFSAPSPFQGPVITDVGGDNQIIDFNAAVGDSVTIEGSNLDSVTSVTVGGVEAEVVSTEDSRVSFIVPNNLELGAQELVVITAGQSIRVQEQIVIASTNVQSASSCDGQEPNLWTKRVSDTEAKVYIKCGTPGVSYRIDVQQNGGDYETLITRTLVDESDDRQVFNSVGRYIVRTIDLESKTRIRIFADDEKQWQVVYNQR